MTTWAIDPQVLPPRCDCLRHEYRMMFSSPAPSTHCLIAVEMSVTKDGIKFSTTGDIGNASVICRQNTAIDKVGKLLGRGGEDLELCAVSWLDGL